MKRVIFLIAGVATVLFVSFSQKLDVNPSDYATQIAMEGFDRHHLPDRDLHQLSLSTATNPKFPIGSTVYILQNEDQNSKRIAATVKKAYTTFAYSVAYKPSHKPNQTASYKWIVHEEISHAKTNGFPVGQRVLLNTNKVPGMQGALAYIEEAEMTTVYQLQFDNPIQNIEAQNKWWVERELRASK